jgi:hypothetical protein
MEQISRTYLYYSDDKILQYKQQVPASRWERAIRRVNQIGFTVVGTGPTFTIGPPASEPILRTMQEMWIDLADEGRIGTFDEPREYVYGRLDFHYGLYNIVDPPVLFLVGATDRTIVALGGSQKHVRGFRDREIRVAEDAQAVFVEPDVPNLILQAEALSQGAPAETMTPAAPDEDIRAQDVARLYEDWQSRQIRRMEFEVLARTELRSSVHPPIVESTKSVLIGSPVFVAQI